MNKEEIISRMRELSAILTEASKAYYAEDREIMSNFEYDRLYDELASLEDRSGIVLSGSPTVTVGYASAKELPKEAHALPMLSLDKTKDREALAAFCGDRRTILSWKLDGLTIVLTYENGVLTHGVTRGNGQIGEVVTDNVRAFRNVPLKVPFDGRLILRGEALIRYSDFERINASLPEGEKPYKNPRNLCSGAVRQLSSAVTAQRSVYFYAFGLVEADRDFENSHEKELLFLRDLGFTIVPYRIVDGSTAGAAVDTFEKEISNNDFPSDGLVALYDDIAYGRSLGTTAKFPRNGLAFKWQDETAETTLRYVEWDTSRTGRINPVAVFDPVELEGTTVSRASVHNVSFLRGLKLGIGDRITVYKANMIIPQIAENLTGSGTVEIPDTCPVCGERAEVRSEAGEEDGAETLFCTNPACPARKIRQYSLLCSRDALNIEGLSEATLERFVAAGILPDAPSLFRLKEHRDTITGMEGFGERSYLNLVEAVENARHTTWPRLLYALGIPGIGAATAKVICRSCPDPESFLAAGREELTAVDTVGPVLAGNIAEWKDDPKNRELLLALAAELIFEDVPDSGSELAGRTYVITGAVTHFKNRAELASFIEERGGHTASAVSAKTYALISDDPGSNSGKSKKARQLGIPVITEEEFLAQLGEGGRYADQN